MCTRILLLLFGVFCCSTAVIFIKESELNPVLLAALRLIAAAIFISPLFIRDLRKKKYKPSYFLPAFVPGIFLGLHFISWIYAVHLTSAVNASLIVNMVPIVMPFIIFAMVREKITKRELAGSLTAVMGLIILVAGDIDVKKEYMNGDMLCFLSMIFLSIYLALARKNCHFDTMWLYLFPLYMSGGLLCLMFLVFCADPFLHYSYKETLLLLALVIVPTIAGHSILNYSMKHLRSQIVSIINMGQFISAGIMAFFLFAEVPEITFYMAAILLLGGAVIAMKKKVA